MAAVIRRRAGAVWNGDLRSGNGRISVGSGALKEIAYGFGTRFENEPGTNPEELIAGAHAGCFSMAFAHELSTAGYQVKRVQTQAICSLSPVEGGFRITKMRLETEAEVPGIDEATFQEIANGAKVGCPVSDALKGGPEIELDAKLV